MIKISQREARQLRKEVRDLKRQIDLQRNAWAEEWPGGVHLATINVDPVVTGSLRTARKLAHAVVVTAEQNGQIFFYALPLPGGDK